MPDPVFRAVPRRQDADPNIYTDLAALFPRQRRINGGRRARAPTTAASRATADACGGIIRGDEPGGRLPHWAQPGDVPGSFRAAVAVQVAHSCIFVRFPRLNSKRFSNFHLLALVVVVPLSLALLRLRRDLLLRGLRYGLPVHASAVAARAPVLAGQPSSILGWFDSPRLSSGTRPSRAPILTDSGLAFRPPPPDSHTDSENEDDRIDNDVESEDEMDVGSAGRKRCAGKQKETRAKRPREEPYAPRGLQPLRAPFHEDLPAKQQVSDG
ncbi:hypothetical protein GGF50DRAFT_120375 [Schizophyllum commune]